MAQEWTRTGPMNVALKRLDISQNITALTFKHNEKTKVAWSRGACFKFKCLQLVLVLDNLPKIYSTKYSGNYLTNLGFPVTVVFVLI